MAQFSKILLPPILDYNYPAFRYENDNGGNVEVNLKAYLSVTNTIEQVDHVQIKIVSLNTNKNALNPNIFTENIYFISMIDENELILKINTVINGENIFKTTEEEIYPSYYKMQIRLGLKGNSNYDPAWGQNVPEEWIKNNTENFSEWSNSSVLKTVNKPEFGIFTLDANIENTITDSNYLWMGYYNTEDGNESLKKYYFELLDKNNNLIERSEDFYIGEYETPSISYKFNEVFTSQNEYIISLFIETVTGYKDHVNYNITTNFSYVKIYNIFKVEENDDDAHNLINIKARQIKLEPSIEPIESNWKTDLSMEVLGETGVTHYLLREGVLSANEDFSIPYNNFSILLSITNFSSKIQTSIRDCFKNKNYIMYLGAGDDFGSNFYLGSYKYNNLYYFVLKEDFGTREQKNSSHYYISDSVASIEDNEEYIFIIKKNKGDTIFQSKKWLINNFE